jgi:hypothetical protein
MIHYLLVELIRLRPLVFIRKCYFVLIKISTHIENKKRMFRRLISNIKKYADVLLEWNKKDILNNYLHP